MTAAAARGVIAVLLLVAALVLLMLAIAGHPWPAGPAATSVYLLADRSASIPPSALQESLRESADSILALNPAVELHVIDFAGRAAPARRVASPDAAARAPAAAGLMPQATNLAEPIRRAMLEDEAAKPVALVILSDGNATTGDTTRALADAASAGVTVLWRAVAATSEAPRIGEVLAPARARPGQRVPVTVRLAGTTDRPLRVALSSNDASLSHAESTIGAGGLQPVTLSLEVRAAGPLLLDVALLDAASARLVDERKQAALIDVEPPAPVLYVSDRPAALARSLLAGGWTLRSVTSRRLDELASQFEAHAAVVLDDVPATAARPTTWNALADAVHDRGTGLLVLGGKNSFAGGSYRGSNLERVLPVVSRPAALGDAAAVAFVVDKSGSMGASAAGVDRLRLAQRAVVETAGALMDRDQASLLVFDVTTRELIPLSKIAQFRQAVAAPWPAQPRGGTRIAPAIEQAIAQLETAVATRRILVLVTDGYVDEVPVAGLRAQLSRAGIELIALAVGADANAAALAGLADPGQATVVRVGEAADLPRLMRSSVDERRAPVERGAMAVRALRPLPFVPQPGRDWPPVAAYAVTSARKDAVVHVESARGDPLIVYRQHGLGRAVAVVPGLGAWTPDWLRWRDWPALSGGLIDWVSSDDAGAGLAIRARDLPMELRIDVDQANAGLWSEQTPTNLRVVRPSGRTDDVRLAASAPGRVSAYLPDPDPGLYTFTVVTTNGAQRLAHLRQPLAERGELGANPAVDEWQRSGLTRAWSVAALDQAVRSGPASSADTDPPLLLALLLFLCAVLLDRLSVRRGGPILRYLAAFSSGFWQRGGAPGP